MACPTQAFQIDLPQLLQQPKGPLQLCCYQNLSAPPSALRLNCLQQLSPLMLCYLIYQHQQITLYLTPELCQSCLQQWYPQGLLQQLAAYHIPAEQLKLVLQAPAQPHPTDSPQPENQRRQLLRNFWHRTEEQSKKAAIQAAEAITATGSATWAQVPEPEIFPQRLPLYALYAKKLLPIHGNEPLPFRQLTCQACSFCGACSHICPTKALTLTEQDGEKQLQYRPELCISCQLCQAICMQQGLQWGDFMQQQQFLANAAAFGPQRRKNLQQLPAQLLSVAADGRWAMCLLSAYRLTELVRHLTKRRPLAKRAVVCIGAYADNSPFCSLYGRLRIPTDTKQFPK